MSRRVCSPPSPPPPDPHLLHYGKADNKVVEKVGDNGWTHSGEGATRTALFSPLGFYEVAHKSGYGKGQISTTRRICTLPLFSLPSHKTHFDKLKPLRIDYCITTKLARRWWRRQEIMDGIDKGRKRSTGSGERIMWTEIFFHWVDEVAHDLGYGEGQIEKSQCYITSLRLFFYAKIYWIARRTTPILLSFTRPPTFIGRHAHLEHITISTRHRRKTFITDSQASNWGQKFQNHGRIPSLHQKLDA